MSIDKLTLEAGVDIPFVELKVNIHQPTVREIAIIGEKRFFEYLRFFQVSMKSVVDQFMKTIPKSGEATKEELENLVKSALGIKSDFEVFMQMVNEETENKAGVEAILLLMFPQYTFEFEQDVIVGIANDPKATTKMFIVREDSFKQLKEIIDVIFCLNAVEGDDYNPVDDKAKAIAEKLKRGREKARISKGDAPKDTYVIANYVSCLGIGSNALNILNVNNLTLYQLFNQMKRFGLKTQHEHGVSAALAGAKDVEIVDWLISL